MSVHTKPIQRLEHALDCLRDVPRAYLTAPDVELLDVAIDDVGLALNHLRRANLAVVGAENDARVRDLQVPRASRMT